MTRVMAALGMALTCPSASHAVRIVDAADCAGTEITGPITGCRAIRKCFGCPAYVCKLGSRKHAGEKTVGLHSRIHHLCSRHAGDCQAVCLPVKKRCRCSGSTTATNHSSSMPWPSRASCGSLPGSMAKIRTSGARSGFRNSHLPIHRSCRRYRNHIWKHHIHRHPYPLSH